MGWRVLGRLFGGQGGAARAGLLHLARHRLVAAQRKKHVDARCCLAAALAPIIIGTAGARARQQPVPMLHPSPAR
jgi:hypothetical protein